MTEILTAVVAIVGLGTALIVGLTAYFNMREAHHKRHTQDRSPLGNVRHIHTKGSALTGAAFAAGTGAILVEGADKHALTASALDGHAAAHTATVADLASHGETTSQQLNAWADVANNADVAGGLADAVTTLGSLLG